MPTLLLRMKLVADYSLEELEDIFNTVLRKVVEAKGPLVSDAAAVYYFPEVFNAPQDEYMAALLHEVATEHDHKQIDSYIGNIHIRPISRLWSTNVHEDSVRPIKKRERKNDD